MTNKAIRNFGISCAPGTVCYIAIVSNDDEGVIRYKVNVNIVGTDYSQISYDINRKIHNIVYKILKTIYSYKEIEYPLFVLDSSGTSGGFKLIGETR